MAYFDWNATAPLLPAARTAWLEATGNGWGNPSSLYRTGIRAKGMLDSARADIAAALEVDASCVIFTSGASESNNAFLRIVRERELSDGQVWISSVEHPSVREACRHYWGDGRIVQMPVTRDGVLDVDWLADRLKTARPALVCLMAVNNVTGVIQPVRQVNEICRLLGIPFFCDAVQWFGKCGGPLGAGAGGMSFSLSAHKFGGLKGTGCLVLAEEWLGSRLQFGGGQESGSRAGTEDVAGIAAMAAALVNRLRPVDTPVRAARDTFEGKLTGFWPDVVIHGKQAPRVWNTCCFSLPDYPANRWISRLDRKGFEVSSGAACSSAKDGPSSVLRSMGVDDSVAGRTIRVSGGWETSPDDWDALFDAIGEVYHELGESGPESGPGYVIRI